MGLLGCEAWSGALIFTPDPGPQHTFPSFDLLKNADWHEFTFENDCIWIRCKGFRNMVCGLKDLEVFVGNVT